MTGPSGLCTSYVRFLAAITDDRVPVAIRLFLVACRDMERQGLERYDKVDQLHTVLLFS